MALRVYSAIGAVIAGVITVPRMYLCVRFNEKPVPTIQSMFAGIGYGVLWPLTMAFVLCARKDKFRYYPTPFKIVKPHLMIFTPSINPYTWRKNTPLIAYLVEKGVLEYLPQDKKCTSV
jgi:hypothetical protein